MSWLTPERKAILAAGALGYALCLWQALCVVGPMAHLAPESEPGVAWMAIVPGDGQDFRRALNARLALVGLRGGEVRRAVASRVVQRAIDPADLHPEDPDSWSRVARLELRSKSKAVTRPSPVYTMASLLPGARPGGRPAFTAPPGVLAARFESGPDGAASVGHTPGAGTSYGTFQIASGTPTYNNFLRFLEAKAPDWQARLRNHGPANTGSTSGSVPEEWRRIARENPKRFERLQYEFILNTHYRPAVADIYEETGVDVSALSPASREVLWSAVVQHGAGGGTGIFVAAINALKGRMVEDKRLDCIEQALIEQVYANRLRAFGGNPRLMRSAMTARYSKEMSQALGLLERHYSGS